jgi:chromosome partitioning protein
MSQIYATVNQKGGVGKTTTALNLATYLATFGKSVLLVDMDAQGNATVGIGIDREKLEHCIYDVLIDGIPITEVIINTSIAGLFIAPSTPKLAGAEVELVPENFRELRLKKSLEGIKDNYDFVIIDCPPSLSLLTVNALAASDEVIIPIQCEYYALEGLSQLTKTIDLVRGGLNPALKIKGIILTMYDSRTLLSEQVSEEVRKHFGKKVFKTIIPRNVRLAESPSFGQPILFYDPSSSGAVAYEALAREVLDGHLN